jgi:hypothetical protein
MPWWVWVALVAVVYFAYAYSRRYRNRRVRAVIYFPPKGHATIQIDPGSATPANLSLTVLCYASKVWWLLQSEFNISSDIFRQLIGEAIDFWSEGHGDLIDRMPTAAALRSAEDHPTAVPGGERFDISFYRTQYQTLRNRVWIINSLPKPGLAANIPWSAIILLNAVFVLLNDPVRERLHRALSSWADLVLAGGLTDQSLAGLNALFAVSLQAWEEANVLA